MFYEDLIIDIHEKLLPIVDKFDSDNIIEFILQPYYGLWLRDRDRRIYI